MDSSGLETYEKKHKKQKRHEDDKERKKRKKEKKRKKKSHSPEPPSSGGVSPMRGSGRFWVSWKCQCNRPSGLNHGCSN
uniref:Mediator of RNA polymerase II transcription subunit 19 n=1 Tax=Glossina pallidipes TaxID=7398 RepID=A0A1A9ZCY0_GLOPL